MKQERLYEAIGDIDEAYVSEARRQKSRPVWRKWGAVAACLALLVTAASIFLPFAPDGEEITPTDAVMDTSHLTEMATNYSEAYLYCVDDGAFVSYVGGKVIEENKIGNKIEDVTLTAGWRNNEGDWLTAEHLRGEIYLIDGISRDVAVALKFLDKGDALTTTHYYTLLNPEADLTEVLEYCISIRLPNNDSIPQAPQSTADFVEGNTQIAEEDIVESVTVTSEASE